MKKILAVCLLLASTTIANSDDMAIVAHGISKHINNHNFNEKNYGAALRYEHDDYGLQTGIYRNSLNNTSIYAGVDWSPIHFKSSNCLRIEAGPYYGFVTGYRWDITPIVGLQAAIRCDTVYARFRINPDLFYNSKAFGAIEVGLILNKF